MPPDPNHAYWSIVLAGLVPSAELTVALIKTLFCGSFAAFISIAVPDSDSFSEDFLKHLFQFFRPKIAYCLMGGIMAAAALFLTEDHKFVFMQTITVGAAWPHFTRRLFVRSRIENFVASGQPVKVKEKGDA